MDQAAERSEVACPIEPRTEDKRLLQAKAYVEGPDVGGKVVYGDSVAPWTPVWIRLGGSKVVLTTAERVEEELVVFRSSWRAMEDPSCEMSDRKESLELVDVEVWSEVGWTRAARLIRHRLAAHKRLFRVACDAGVVDVTGDHSLLLSDGTPVTARELRANQDRLLLAPTLPRASRPTKGADDDERARAHEWEAGGRDDESASCCDAESARVVDQAFDFEGGLTLRSSDQLSAAEAFELIEGAGVVALRDGSYEVGRSCTRIARDAATVRSVTEIPGITYLANLANLANLATPTTAADNSAENSGGTSGGVLGGAPPYVYDFTTASGHFAAGVGRVVVHNTDSIFIVFKNEDAASGRKLVGRDALASSIRQVTFSLFHGSQGRRPARCAHRPLPCVPWESKSLTKTGAPPLDPVSWRLMASHGVAWRRMGSLGVAWGRMGAHGGAWGRMRTLIKNPFA